MKRYFWQENNGEIEILLENGNTTIWICDCGLSNEKWFETSKKKAETIVRLFNENLAG